MSQPVSGTSAELAGWLFFKIAAGHVALPILAFTLLFSRTARQHFTLINVCLSYIVAGVVGALLFYVGKHRGSDPGRSLCVAQASLEAALPMLTTTATLALVFHLWRIITSEEDLAMQGRKRTIYSIGLFIVPYVFFGLFIAIGIALGFRHGEDVNREQLFFYCSLNWEPLTLAISVLSTIVCLVTLAFEVHLVYWLRHHWRAIRRSKYDEDLDFHMYIRVGIFTLYQTTSIVLNLVSLERNLGVLPMLFSASVGMVLFLLLASHPAVIQAWSFRHPVTGKFSFPWNHHPRNPHPELSQPSEALHFRTTNSSGVTTGTGASSLLGGGKGAVGGVTIIGRPEEAFSRDQRKQRTTISTWGF